jgi:hypothetical protein
MMSGLASAWYKRLDAGCAAVTARQLEGAKSSKRDQSKQGSWSVPGGVCWGGFVYVKYVAGRGEKQVAPTQRCESVAHHLHFIYESHVVSFLSVPRPQPETTIFVSCKLLNH